MSFPTNPDIYDPQPPPNVCLACFAPGNTPSDAFVTFGGIVKGPLAAPGDPPPPNGQHHLTPVAPCLFSLAAGGTQFAFELAPTPSLLDVRTAAPLIFFRSQQGAICPIWMANDNQNPAVHKYHSGFAIVTYMLNGVTFSFPDLMDLLVIPGASTTFGNSNPAPNDQAVHRISRQSDNTNVHILYDHS